MKLICQDKALVCLFQIQEDQEPFFRSESCFEYCHAELRSLELKLEIALLAGQIVLLRCDVLLAILVADGRVVASDFLLLENLVVDQEVECLLTLCE